MASLMGETLDFSMFPSYAQFWLPGISQGSLLEITAHLIISYNIPIPELPDVSVDALIEAPALDTPRIDPLSGPEVSEYARRVRLQPGTTATVMLVVAIAADGSVVSARVVRSNAGDAANAAALDYARATRWIPGMVDGHPRPMEANLTVILEDRNERVGST